MTPDNYTNQEFFLDVGNGHQLYVHDWGKSDAKLPIIFLHGGPGGEVSNKHKMSFQPAEQRVVFFDQRGAGKSLPKKSLKHNTTDDLVNDLEKITDKLNIKKFILVGGSWGSCLALAYALRHPKNVQAMVLHGIFTGSQQEIDWVAKGVFRNFFPDVWDRYKATVPEPHANDPNDYHYSRILGKDEKTSIDSARAVANFEAALSSLDDRFQPDDKEDFDPTLTTIETHYMANTCFIPDRYILDNAHKLRIPVWLVQGRYDMICPPMTAYELHHQLANSTLIWTLSGHRQEHETSNIVRTLTYQLSVPAS